MTEYNELTGIISKLKSDLSELRTQWQDHTAGTYDTINENIESISKYAICMSDAVEKAYKAISSNYDAQQYDAQVNQLYMKAIRL